MSLEVAKVIHHVQANHDIPAPVIASALAMICGLICLALGLLRVGFLLEFIPGTLNAYAKPHSFSKTNLMTV